MSNSINSQRRAIDRLVYSALAMVALGACMESKTFAASYLLDRLRILAIRAATPSLGPGESTALDVLVYNPQSSAAAYEWSWCPLRSGADVQYSCALGAQDLHSALAGCGHGDVAVDYDLGNSATVQLDYLGSAPALRDLCAAARSANRDQTISQLQCNNGLTLSVALSVTASEHKVTAIKQVTLLLDAQQVPNHNPEITAVRIAAQGEDASASVELPSPAGEVALTYGATYQLVIDVPATAAEETHPGRATEDGGVGVATEDGGMRAITEMLTASWFVTGGTLGQPITTSSRNSDQPFDSLCKNSWTLPSASEATASSAEIWIVIRDDRGGVGWAVRTAPLSASGL